MIVLIYNLYCMWVNNSSEPTSNSISHSRMDEVDSYIKDEQNVIDIILSDVREVDLVIFKEKPVISHMDSSHRWYMPIYQWLENNITRMKAWTQLQFPVEWRMFTWTVKQVFATQTHYIICMQPDENGESTRAITKKQY